MRSRGGRILRFILRWTIAVVGIAWVVSNLHWRDRVLFHQTGDPAEAVLLEPATETSSQYRIANPETGLPETVGAINVLNPPDRKTVQLRNPEAGAPAEVKLLAMRLQGDPNQNPIVLELLVKYDRSESGAVTHVSRFVKPAELVDYRLEVPQPRIQQGVQTMLSLADHRLLIASVAVMPLTYAFTTIRWQWLLRALGIVLPLSRTLVLNMVGAFYNTFMPGSTGGDVLKAYYAAKQAPTRRTAAVMSVIVDRVIGLLALIILGGSMAALQYAMSSDHTDPVSRACLRVALVAAALLTMTLVGMLFVYATGLRKALGISALVARAPMQEKVQKVIEVVRLYRQRPALIFWSILITFPVHVTVVVSALLAGKAFGLPISSPYYFIVVPVVVLVGAIPISPQGVGVMEAFAFYLTRQQGATVNQALALTMSIRLVQIFWNLVGGLFVLRGGYHSPSEKEMAGDPESSKDKAHETNNIQDGSFKVQPSADAL